MCDVNCVAIKSEVFSNVANCSVKTILDIYSYSQFKGEILYISNFVVDTCYRGKRLGGKELLKLLEKNEDKLIILDVKYLPLEPNESISNKEKINKLIKLGKYFKKLGFIDINKYFGRHQDKISMCYKNTSYKIWTKS